MRPPYTWIVESLPSTTPFIGPEALERRVGRDIELRLGANESPFGPSPLALEAMRAQASQVQNYGDHEGYLLREALAAKHGVAMGNIVLGAGIDELLALCCRLFVDEGAPIVTTYGSYATFEYGAAGCGADFHRVPYKDGAPDLAALAVATTEHEARILYLANPDNPSGAWHEPHAISALVAALPPGCVLLLDEAYAEFAPEVPEIRPDNPQVIRLRTFSKVHGMAGARVAYVIAHPDHCEALNKIRMHFGVNTIAQAGALASLSDPAFVAHVISETCIGRAEVARWVESRGLRPLSSHTNFLTVDVGSKARADAILQRLLHLGVFIRKPGAPPLDRCIRITIGRPDQRRQFAEIFERVLQELD